MKHSYNSNLIIIILKCLSTKSIIFAQAKVGDFGLAREGAEYKMEEEDEDGDPRKVLNESEGYGKLDYQIVEI